MSSPSLPITCVACGSTNAADSRFCRLCGVALSSTPQSSPDVASEAISAPAEATPLVASSVADSSPEVGQDFSSPGEIDARRARQLLERALYLTERGDTAGAVLACRQSIALAPNMAAGHSMLGLLLERAGDVPHAIAAYEKALHLSPGSALDRENLELLREKSQQQQGANLFHFDDAELFEGTTNTSESPANEKKPNKTDVLIAGGAPASGALASQALEAPRISAAAPGLPADTVLLPPQSQEGVAASPAALTTSAQANSTSASVTQNPISQTATTVTSAPASPVIDRRASERRHSVVPVPQDRRQNSERRDASHATMPARVSPITFPMMQPAENQWGTLKRRSSYFTRSLPLVGATVLSLGFLVWARGFAIARSANNVEPPTVIASDSLPNDPIPTDPIVQPNQATIPNGTPPNLAPVGTPAPQNGGFPISNRPITPAAAPVTPPTTTSNPAAAPATAGSNGPTRAAAPRPNAPRSSAQRTNPDFPQIVPPAPIPPLARPQNGARNNGEGNNSNTLTLPAPVIAAPVPASPPVAVLPPGASAPALNPAGSGGRGYVRITQGRVGTSALPQRPAAQAGADERGAANATRAGQTDRAIERLSAALSTDANDAGYRYQQRAQLFLDRGDYGRAVDDFQAAISAYNEQILRGEQVNSARAGVRAARSGLNLALAGNRR